MSDQDDMRQKIDDLRQQAARARRLALVPSQDADRQAFLNLARELSRQAHELEAKLNT